MGCKAQELIQTAAGDTSFYVRDQQCKICKTLFDLAIVENSEVGEQPIGAKAYHQDNGCPGSTANSAETGKGLLWVDRETPLEDDLIVNMAFNGQVDTGQKLRDKYRNDDGEAVHPVYDSQSLKLAEAKEPRSLIPRGKARGQIYTTGVNVRPVLSVRNEGGKVKKEIVQRLLAVKMVGGLVGNLIRSLSITPDKEELLIRHPSGCAIYEEQFGLRPGQVTAVLASVDAATNTPFTLEGFDERNLRKGSRWEESGPETPDLEFHFMGYVGKLCDSCPKGVKQAGANASCRLNVRASEAMQHKVQNKAYEFAIEEA